MPDSDSEAVYEFTQDAQHGDLRDPHSRRRRSLGLDVEPNSVLAFWRLVCDTFRKIVDSKYFGRGIMIAILVNTLSMGIEYHEQVGRSRAGALCLLPSCPPASASSPRGWPAWQRGQEGDAAACEHFRRVKTRECHAVSECGSCPRQRQCLSWARSTGKGFPQEPGFEGCE